jgi:predicted nucleic acid-binding protein
LLRVTSAVSLVEVRRVALRSGSAAERGKAEEVLRGVVSIRLTDEILRRAGDVNPPNLRSLDAIHLAAALELEARGAVEVSDFVAYDLRLLDAARAAGLRVAAPGRPA